MTAATKHFLRIHVTYCRACATRVPYNYISALLIGYAEMVDFLFVCLRRDQLTELTYGTGQQTLLRLL